MLYAYLIDIMFNTSIWSLPNRIKLTAVGLGSLITALLIWVVASGKEVDDDITILLPNSQQVSLKQLSLHIGDGVEYRLQALEAVAQKIAIPLQKGNMATQQYMAQLPLSQTMFNGGMVVYNHHGEAVAHALGVHNDEKPNGYALAEVLRSLQRGGSMIGPPEVHAVTKAPVLTLYAPILNEQGHLLGAVQGLIILTEPNFLDRIFSHYSIEGESFLVVDPVRRVVIYATDNFSAVAAAWGKPRIGLCTQQRSVAFRFSHTTAHVQHGKQLPNPQGKLDAGIKSDAKSGVVVYKYTSKTCVVGHRRSGATKRLDLGMVLSPHLAAD